MARIYKSKGETKTIISLILIVIIAIVIIYAVWFIADSLQSTQDQEALTATKNAVMKSAVQCYAIEGQYPTGLSYLEENYGLTLNKEKYVYHYESIGANIVPIVDVYPL